MKTSDIQRLINLVTKCQINGYDDTESENGSKSAIKEQFISLSRSYLRMIAKELCLTKEQFDLRVNRAGVAVSGDIHLHTDKLYVDFSQSCLGSDMGFMFRHCESQKDFTGGANRWMKWERLTDIPYVIEQFKNAMAG
jgi:hypothetical protein